MKDLFFRVAVSHPAKVGETWKILVVDDDAEMHSVTHLILAKTQYAGRGISIINAHSASEAKELLHHETDVAVILLDVVMETDDAGLRLVHYIRRNLNNRSVRIILRTGQPGQAPEEKVIVDYDINDYKEKTELTSQKLTTSVISALRSYQDIMTVETSRAGLQRIIDTSNDLFKVRRFDPFASAAVKTFESFITGTEGAALVMRQNGDSPSFIGGANGDDSREILHLLTETLDGKTHHYGNDTALYIPVEDDLEMAAFLRFERELSEIERTLLETLASKIAVGFASVHHYELLREANENLEARVADRTRELELVNLVLENLATLDPLTNVFNRRHFDDLTRREITRAGRTKRPFAVFMIDIDHFKTVNDTYGHAIGDLALQTLILVCHAELRDIDIICRYGGEEFAVLLPETGAAEATHIADRLRKEVSAVSIPAGDRTFHMSVSIGVSEWRAEEDSIDPALVRADTALYAAKHGGRNQVVAG